MASVPDTLADRLDSSDVWSTCRAGYADKGRGALVVAALGHHGILSEFRSDYLCAQTLRTIRISHKFHDLIATYDPSRSCVLVMVTRDIVKWYTYTVVTPAA